MNPWKKATLASEMSQTTSPVRAKMGKRMPGRSQIREPTLKSRLETANIETRTKPVATPAAKPVVKPSTLDEFIRHTRSAGKKREQRKVSTSNALILQSALSSTRVIKGIPTLPVTPNLNAEETKPVAKDVRPTMKPSETHAVFAQLKIGHCGVNVEYVRVPHVFAISTSTKAKIKGSSTKNKGSSENTPALKRPSNQSLEDLDVRVVHKHVMNSAA